MTSLNATLESGNLTVLLWTAASLGFLHTILGPDHYIPFVMMAKAHRWSRFKTAWVTFLCGVGHVGSTVVIGAILAGAGMAFTEWEGSEWSQWHKARGDLAVWLLIGVGVAFMIWGVIRALRGHTHTHAHLHEEGSAHDHEHDHTGEHMHISESKVRSLTPWVLFTIFVFGPCESLIPLMLASWAVAGVGGTVLVAGMFSVVTVVTILATVGVLMTGISHIPAGKLDRWSTALAGASLVGCGAAILWLGI